MPANSEPHLDPPDRAPRRGARMRAGVSDRYGPPEVLRVDAVEVPALGDDEVLVRVRAATVGAADAAARAGRPLFSRLYFGLVRPKRAILGSEFSGEVVEVGSAVTRFAPGDRVLGVTGTEFGGHAEYVRVSQNGVIAPLPGALSFETGAALADATALAFVRDEAGLRAGQSILVNGATGAVGSAAVQLARHLGAQVTAVCSTANLELAASLGADEVIDYTSEDFTRNGKRYDVVFDAAGASSFARARRSLEPGGVYLTTVPSAAVLVQMPWTKRFGRRRARVAFTGLRSDEAKLADLLVLVGLAESGALVPVVDGRYPLEQIVEAHRHLGRGKRGNVLITG